MRQFIYFLLVNSILCLFSLSGVTADPHHIPKALSINYTLNDGIPSLETYDVFEDSKGYIWISSDKGVVRYDGYSFENVEMGIGKFDNTVLWLTEDETGKIWFITRSNELSYHENGVVQKYKHHEALREGLRESVHSSWLVNFFRGEEDEIYFRVYEDSACFKITNSGEFRLLTQEEFNVLFEEKKRTNSIRLGRHDEHYRSLALVGQLLKPASIFEEFSFVLNDSLYVLYGSKGASIKNLNTGRVVTELISDKWITGVELDRENGIWLSSLNDGVFYIPNKNIEVLHRVEPNEDRISILVNTKTDSLLFVTGFQRNWNYLDLKSKNTGLRKSNMIRIDEADSVDLVPSGATLRYEMWDRTQRASQFFWLSDSLVLVSNGGYIHFRLFRLTPGNKIEKNFINLRSKFHHICKTNDGRYLAVDMKGISELDFDNFALKEFYDDPRLGKRTNSFIHISDSLFVLGTKGNGVTVLNGEEIFEFYKEDGLVSNLINQVIPFNRRNEFLLATSKGLQYVDWQDSTITTKNLVTYHDGMLFNNICNAFIREEKLYFASEIMIARLDTNKLFVDRVDPLLHISRVRFKGEKYPVKDRYEVDYTQDEIELDVTGISLRSQGNIKYHYKLEGVDDSWNVIDYRQIRYTSLDPGDYTLKIKAENADGKFSIVKEIEVTIVPAFWMTLWFKATGFIFILSVVVYIFYWLYRNRLEKVEQQQQLSSFHQQSLKLQMNPHFIFNTLNTIQLNITKLDQLKAYQLLTNFSKLIRYTLKTSTVSKISLREEIDYISNYVDLEREKLEHGVDFKVEVDESIDVEVIQIPPMMIQPLVENAIWHGLNPMNKKGTITLQIEQKENAVVFKVIDNGVGKKEEKGQQNLDDLPSIALKNILERIRLLEQTEGKKYILTVISNEKSHQETGTTAALEIPI